MSCKIHLAVRGLGLPVRFILTGGQRHDITQAHALIDGLAARYDVAAFDVGSTGGDTLHVSGVLSVGLAALRAAWEGQP